METHRVTNPIGFSLHSFKGASLSGNHTPRGFCLEITVEALHRSMSTNTLKAGPVGGGAAVKPTGTATFKPVIGRRSTPP
jgi:hypothetical protein